MKCECVNVTMGGHENTVTVEAPQHVVDYRRLTNPDLGSQVSLDRCIAAEVQELWAQGITTNGSCCGHNIDNLPAYIGVRIEHAPQMEALGYEHIIECPFPEYHFKSKTIVR